MIQKRYIIRQKSLFWAIVFFVFLMQDAVTQVLPAFKYADEIAALIFLAYYLLEFGRNKLPRTDLKIAVICMAMCVLGFLGNEFSSIQPSLKYQIFDAFNIFKYVMAIWGATRFFEKYQTKKYLIHYLAGAIRVTVLISTFFMMMNLFRDIGMHTDYRMGIRTYHFIFPRVGELYQACIMWLVLLTAEHYYYPEKKNYFFVVLVLLNMASTLRSRAIAFVGVYLLVCYLLLYRKNRKLKIWHYVYIALLVLPIGFEQLEYYLLENSRARGVLLRCGIETASNYFPLGAGFGTYGTAVARDTYSKLYSQYDFSSVWGLAQDGTFLTDNYWPAIMGEFGYIGTILNVFLLGLIFKRLIWSTDNPYSQICVYFTSVTLLISSTVSSSFFACTQLMIFVCMVSKLDYSQTK